MRDQNYGDTLFLSSTDFDVTLVVEETELPAHRSILSERSEYFKTMFSSSFIEANSDKIVLKETNLEAFKRVFKYIYTGKVECLCDDSTAIFEAFDLFLCSRFYMVDTATSAMFEYIQKKGSDNPCMFLCNALAYYIDEFITMGTDLAKNQIPCFFNFNMFEQLSPHAVEYVLKLRLAARESTIFEALVWWRLNNPQYSSAFPNLLNYIDLYLLGKTKFDMLFEPTQLIDPISFHELLTQQCKRSREVVNTNVINDINDYCIVDGTLNQSRIGIVSRSRSWITIDLKKKFWLNCLKFKLHILSSYIVLVSNNMFDWERIIDHSKFECLGQQALYFDERVMRFIRIQSVDGYIQINTKIEALYSTETVEIDPATTLTVPNRNIIPNKMLRKWKSPNGNGFTTGLTFHNGESLQRKGDIITYQFCQPYIIGSLKLLFGDERSYIVSVKGRDHWTRVFAEDNVSGWRTATFEKQPVVFIQIRDTTTLTNSYDLFKLECPAT